MQFIAQPGKVYSFTKAVSVLKTAALFNRVAEVETRLYNRKLVTIQYDPATSDVTLIGSLPDGNQRWYSYRLTVGADDIIDIVMHLNQAHEQDFAEAERQESPTGTVDAAESSWNDPLCW